MSEDQRQSSNIRLDQQCPMNCWWVIAAIDEVTNVPISRQLLQTRVVLVRTQSGAVIALADRCAHRRAPLSRGRLVNEEIECRYHGLRFNAEGLCTRVPSEPSVRPVLHVRAYPVRERGQFVWIWMGDAKNADAALLPNFPLADASDLRFAGYMQINCNYVILIENNMDPAHFQFLHADEAVEAEQPSDRELRSEFFAATTEATARTVSMTLKRRRGLQ